MDEFAPLLLLLFLWLCIGLPASLAKKAANQKKPNQPASSGKTEEPKKAVGAAPAEPERLIPLTPTLSEPDHDDSVFAGSLGSFSTEGYDPCHEEQMSSLERVCEPGKEEPKEPSPESAARLPLGWTDNEIVRGIVMSEILNRKRA